MTTTTRTVSLLAFLALATPAYADVAVEHEPTVEDKKAETEESEADEGIVNWWSWDYGANAKEESHKHLPPPFGWALINFVIFAGILSKILWAPLKRGWVQRHDLIKGELSEARRLREAAEAQLAEYTKKVQNADREVDELLASLRKDAEGDRVRIVAAAEAEAKRLKLEADRQIKIEIERARDVLRAQAVTAAVAAAEEILRKNVNADDQKRLAERYIGDVEAAKAARGGVA